MKYLIFVLLIVLAGCDPADDRFIISNKRGAAICYILSDSEFNIKQFCNAHIEINKDFCTEDRMCTPIIPARSEIHITALGDWEYSLHRADMHFKPWQVFIINAENVGKDSVTLLRENMISKYVITLDYMKLHNWVLEIN